MCCHPKRIRRYLDQNRRKISNKKDNHKLTEEKKFLIDKIKKRISNLLQEYIKMFMELIKKEDVADMKRLMKMLENRYRNIISRLYSSLRKQFHDNI
jgi:two-component sensor histidine kinase